MSKKNDIPKASNGKAPEFDLDGARVPYGDKEASDFVPEKSFETFASRKNADFKE